MIVSQAVEHLRHVFTLLPYQSFTGISSTWPTGHPKIYIKKTNKQEGDVLMWNKLRDSFRKVRRL